jgi:hypothetical protein
MTFTLFVLASPVPVSCKMHGTVSGHTKFCVRGPFNVKVPTSKEKSALAVAMCVQQRRYENPAVPPATPLGDTL